MTCSRSTYSTSLARAAIRSKRWTISRRSRSAPPRLSEVTCRDRWPKNGKIRARGSFKVRASRSGQPSFCPCPVRATRRIATKTVNTNSKAAQITKNQACPAVESTPASRNQQWAPQPSAVQKIDCHQAAVRRTTAVSSTIVRVPRGTKPTTDHRVEQEAQGEPTHPTMPKCDPKSSCHPRRWTRLPNVSFTSDYWRVVS